MFGRKSRASKYTLRLSSARVSPTNSLSETEWDNGSSKHRKTTSSCSSSKTKYYAIIMAAGVTIAIVITIAILVPLVTKSKSTTTKSTTSKPSVTIVLNTSPAKAASVSNATTITESTTSTSTTTTTKSTTSTSCTTTTESTTSTSTTSESTTTTTETTTSTTMGPLRWNTTALTVVGDVFTTNATADYLNAPSGIFLDSFDRIYVADLGNNRIQRFVAGNTSGTTVAGHPNGTIGSTMTRLYGPSDVVVDLSGNIYIADTNNHRVQLWRVNATSGVTVAGNGSSGNSSTQLNGPRGIALDSATNTLYVSDTNNHRVMSYTANSTTGTLVAGGKGPGVNDTQLNSPRGLYFDSSTNSLFIANNAANNVVQWVIGASSWTIAVGNINGTSGGGSTKFLGPNDVILDPTGNIVVVDKFNYRVQFFRAGEKNGTTVAGLTSQYGNSSMKLNQPSSIAFDSQFNLYVSDTVNNRVQKFMRY